VNRVLLNLSDEELKAADSLAGREKVSRSEVFRRALSHMLDMVKGEDAEARRRRRAREIIASMDRSAEILSRDKGWDPMAITRAWRNGGRKL